MKRSKWDKYLTDRGKLVMLCVATVAIYLGTAVLSYLWYHFF